MEDTVTTQNKDGVSFLSNHSLDAILYLGLFIRLVFLFILLGGHWEYGPFFIVDDGKYEALAETYSNNRTSFIDLVLLSKLTRGFHDVFWPWVMCVSSSLFGSIYAGRFVNVILSVLCIKQIYAVTYGVCESEKTALKAAMLFAFLPLTVMTCCFPIKDIFLTFSSLVFFKLILDIQNKRSVKVIDVIYCFMLLVCTYFTRGAVVELYSIFVFVYMFSALYRQKMFFRLLLLILLGGGLFYVFHGSVVDAFSEKIDAYGDYGLENMGGIAYVRMTSLRDFYKLPFTYLFAMVQPLKTNLLTIDTRGNFWLSIISLLNISIYPIALGSFVYLFKEKFNFLFWMSTFILYVSVISLSLGIFRHYLFLVPIQIINFSLVRSYKDRGVTWFIYAGSVVLFILVMLRSVG